MYKERFEEADLLGITPALFLSQPNCADVQAFATEFRQKADELDKGGDVSGARACRLFASISEFHFKPEDKAEPFSNLAAFSDGSRTLVGSDFDENDIATLAQVAEKIEPLALRVRIADLVWSQDKSRHIHARLAISGYIELVRRIEDGTACLRFEQSTATGISVQNFFERSFVIARTIGWDRPENDELKSTYLALLRTATAEGGSALVRFANLGLDYGLSSIPEIVGAVDELADAARKNKDYHDAVMLQELANRLVARVNKNEVAVEGKIALAKIYESQADESDGAFLKAHSLQQAIDSLHGVKGAREERQWLHERLKDAQLHFADDLGTVSHSIDITDEVQRLLDGYVELDLLDCLRRLALTELPKEPACMFQQAKEEAEQYPLSSLFATAILDSKGRTVARTAGAYGNSESLRYKVIQHFGITTSLAVNAAIKPARMEITRRFDVSERTLAMICAFSPFVPNGYENQVARGIQAFLYCDDIVASSILVPFLEAGLRSLVSAAGRTDTKISLGGIEQTIGLGSLLGNHRDILEKVFGDAQIFAIENLFVHELGPKVRHNFCHGLTEDGGFYSTSNIYACKLIFSLVMLALISSEVWQELKPKLEGVIAA